MTPRQKQEREKQRAAAMPPPAASGTMADAIEAASAASQPAASQPAASQPAAVSDIARDLISYLAELSAAKPDAFLAGRPASLARWLDGRRLPEKLAREYLPQMPAGLSRRAVLLAKRTLSVVMGHGGNYAPVPSDTAKPDLSGAPRKSLALQPLAYSLAVADVDRQIAAAAAAAEKGGASPAEAALAWYPLGMTKDGRKALRADWVARLLATRYMPDVLRAAEELATCPGWFLQSGNANGVGAAITLAGLIKSRPAAAVALDEWQ